MTLILLYSAGHLHLILINTSPSVSRGVYVRTFFFDKSIYVAFTSSISIKHRKHILLIKKWRYWNDELLYVYGDHPRSITSNHIGYISKKEVVPMKLIIPF